MKRYLLALLLTLITSPAFAQLPVCNWGDMIYRAVAGYSCLPYDNTAGKFLQGQGASAAPIWTFQAHQNFLLPTQATNTFLGNTSGGNASPTAQTVSNILDTLGYDIIRPPTAGSIPYKSAVAPNNAWQVLLPGTSGQILTSGGTANPPYWSTPVQAALDAICTTVGAIVYYQAPAPASSWVCLTPGTANQALLTGGAGANPAWGTVVLPTRTITTTAPLGGGGTLASDLTLTCTGCLTNTPAALTKTDDTNVTLTLGGTPSTALLQAASLTLGWTGTLAAARLNANVVQSVVNDTNVTGSIAAQALTLGWTGTLSVARGGLGGAATATADRYLKGNGTIWTTSTGAASGVGTCGGATFVKTLNSDAAPTCDTPAGAGDVVGPASSTDNAIVRFDGTTGKLLQDSAVTVADTTGNIVTPGSVSAATAAGAQVATQANMETASATNLLVSPGRQQYHPLHPKTLLRCTRSGTTYTIQTNIGFSASCGRTGVGLFTLTFTTAFSGANTYSCLGTGMEGAPAFLQFNNTTTTTADLIIHNGTSAVESGFAVVCWGDQ